MKPDSEISRLTELMPASGRMYCRLVSKPEQSTVIVADVPLPWKQKHRIAINFDLWRELTRPQRDMVLLQTVCWLTGFHWFRIDLSRGLVIAGLIGTTVELLQADPVGILTAGALTTLAGLQVWRNSQGVQKDLEADEAAIQIAQRRGYGEMEATQSLLEAIEAIARIEGRLGLRFDELVRSQNLRAIAGLSPVGVPSTFR